MGPLEACGQPGKTSTNLIVVPVFPEVVAKHGLASAHFLVEFAGNVAKKRGAKPVLRAINIANEVHVHVAKASVLPAEEKHLSFSKPKRLVVPMNWKNAATYQNIDQDF